MKLVCSPPLPAGSLTTGISINHAIHLHNDLFNNWVVYALDEMLKIVNY